MTKVHMLYCVLCFVCVSVCFAYGFKKITFHSFSLSTQCGPEAHTLIHCPLSDGPQAHTLHSVWAEGPHSVFTFTE